MNNTQLRQHLAEKVCGWELFDQRIWFEGGIAKATVKPEAGLNHWKPDEDIAQAMMLLEKFDGYAVYKNANVMPELKYAAEVCPQKYAEPMHRAKSVPMAICLAAYRASGGRE